MKKNKLLTIILVIVLLLLAAEVGFLAWSSRRAETQAPAETAEPIMETQAEITFPETVPQETQTLPEETEAETEPETAPETQPETQPETEPETEPEPQPEHFVLTFAGDCTLGSAPNVYGVKYSFIDTIGEDYEYPFRNVAEYFQNDDFTMVNLEGVLANGGNSSGALFTFRGPTTYTNILTQGSVEAVTLANNHSMDYGKDGYESTKASLEEAGVVYVEKDGTALYKTESGLTIGMYAGAFSFNGADMKAKFAKLRQDGAEIIVLAAHWGTEGSYHASKGVVDLAHEAIDYGADIVYGHHPHVLQPIEEYNGGIIFYSMGNFCFGGHHWPADLDSVVLQQEVIREVDGTIRLGELKKIPCSITSLPNTNQNNFQPTPYEEGSAAYERAMSKLDGTFKGADLSVNY